MTKVDNLILNNNDSIKRIEFDLHMIIENLKILVKVIPRPNTSLLHITRSQIKTLLIKDGQVLKILRNNNKMYRLLISNKDPHNPWIEQHKSN